MISPLIPSLKAGLVSVMMPAYNAERFIRAAIDSLLNQTYHLWELILVNDGSSDQTETIIRKYSDSRIRLFNQNNSGEASARNNALKHVQGEFLAFLDADDFYHPSFLALMVRYLNQHPEKDGVYCDGFYVDPNNKILSSLSSFRRGPFEGDLFEQLVRASDVFGPPMTVMLRSEKVLSSKIEFDQRIVIGPDWDFFTRLSQFVLFGYLNQQLCFYRIHQTNITLTTGNAKKNQSLALCRRKMLELQKFNQCKEETKSYVFFDLLVNLIENDEEIDRLLSHPSFGQLSPCEQNRLIRLVVIKRLIHQPNHQFIYKWISNAVRLCPKDRKTNLIRIMYQISPIILHYLLNLREKMRTENTTISPFSN